MTPHPEYFCWSPPSGSSPPASPPPILPPLPPSQLVAFCGDLLWEVSSGTCRSSFRVSERGEGQGCKLGAGVIGYGGGNLVGKFHPSVPAYPFPPQPRPLNSGHVFWERSCFRSGAEFDSSPALTLLFIYSCNH